MRSAFLIVYALLVSCIAAGEAQAQEDTNPAEGEIMLTDESVQLTYSAAGNAFDVENSELRIGGFLNEQRDIVGSAAFLVEATRLRYNRFDVSLGPKAYASLLGDADEDIFAIAVGGEMRFELLRRSNVDLVARGWYAPDILTFGTGDRMYDVSGHLELPLTDSVTGLAGYRYFKVNGLTDDTVLENSVFLGFRRAL
ncbi:MAG: YfaZ family outer membrane protein [Gammaproteobacteria bacterium]